MSILSLDQEFLTDYSIFFKQNMLRRVSDLNNKIAYSGPTMVLPKNPMLHMLDNFGHSNQSTDTFNLDDYPFLKVKANIKYLHHFVDFDALNPESLNKFSHRMYRAKLYEGLRSYGMANRRFMIPTLKLDTMLDNKNCIIIENYNPLYRIIQTNSRPINHFYRYRAIFSAALHNTTKYNRQHILVIPVPSDFSYDRSNIISIVQSDEVSPQKLLSTSHFYFFILDLVALLLDNESKLSIFNTLSTQDLSKLNVMLTYHEKSIIFNMGILASLATNKSYVFNFIDNIARIITAPAVTNDVQIAVNEEETEEPLAVPPEPVSVQVVRSSLVEKKSLLIPDIVRNEVVKVIAKTEAPKSTQVIKEVQNEPDIPTDKLPENVPKSSIANLFDQQQIPLSVKQQSRIEILANKHKSIKVMTAFGTKTIEEIINEPIDIALPDTSLHFTNSSGIDSSMMSSSVKTFDNAYREKLMRKDILMNVITFQDNGLFLTDYAEKNDYNSFTRVKHVKATFHDIKGKRHTVNFKLPMPDDEGYYLVNGVRLSLSKQLVNVPICKISPTRVSLISNYNKTLVDKVGSVRHSLVEVIVKKGQEAGITYVTKNNSYIGLDLPYEYKQLGARFSKLTTQDCELYFEYPIRDQMINTKQRTQPLQFFENQYGVIVGRIIKNRDEYIFIDKQNICTIVNIATGNIIKSKFPITECLSELPIPTEWCDLKILDKNIPIVFILGYRYGLSAILNNLKIPHRFVSKKDSLSAVQSKNEIAIQFGDGYLIFNRYPLQHSYILSGLSNFPTLKYCKYIDLDGKDVYYQLLADKGMSTNYLKGIDAYFSFFIDPITKEVLQEMGEPTNTRDLLIRAVDMLVDSMDKAPSALSNFRVRCDEKIPSMIYNEIARQYANYINSNFKDVSFSINTEAIFQRIIQDEAMVLRDDINPIHSIKETHRVTYAGFGGRTSESFVSRDRKYPKDAVGILSESTTDSGTVGMVAALTGNPKIKNLRGMLNTETVEISATNMLSDQALVMPSSTHDD